MSLRDLIMQSAHAARKAVMDADMTMSAMAALLAELSAVDNPGNDPRLPAAFGGAIGAISRRMESGDSPELSDKAAAIMLDFGRRMKEAEERERAGIKLALADLAMVIRTIVESDARATGESAPVQVGGKAVYLVNPDGSPIT